MRACSHYSAHGVFVEDSCSDADAARLLPDRLMSLSVRPVVVDASPNACDYRWDAGDQRYVRDP